MTIVISNGNFLYIVDTSLKVKFVHYNLPLLILSFIILVTQVFAVILPILRRFYGHCDILQDHTYSARHKPTRHTAKLPASEETAICSLYEIGQYFPEHTGRNQI